MDCQFNRLCNTYWMTPTFLAYIPADFQRVDRIRNHILESGVSVELLDISKFNKLASSSLENAKIVVAISNACITDRLFLDFVQLADRLGSQFIPILLEKTEISESILFLTRNRQWIDLSGESAQAMERLAVSMLQGRRDEVVSKLNKTPKLSTWTPMFFAMGAVLVLVIASMFVLLQYLNLSDETKAITQPNQSVTNDLVYVFTSDDGGQPWFNAPGGTLHVTLSTVLEQKRGVTIAYYLDQGNGTYLRAGGTKAVPLVQDGYQGLEFDIADPNDQGVLCLIYDKPDTNGAPRPYILIRDVSPNNFEKPDIVHRPLEAQDSCDQAMNQTIVADPENNLERRAALLGVYNNRSLRLIDGLRPENGGLRLGEHHLSGIYPPPEIESTFYLFGGSNPADLKLVFKMDHDEGYPVYEGAKHERLVACINSNVNGWNFSSFLHGRLLPDGSYKVSKQTLEFDREINACSKFAPEGSANTSQSEWPTGVSMLPLKSEGDFSELNPSDRGYGPMLAGIKLGMNYDLAVREIADAYPQFSKRESGAKKLTSDVYMYPLSRFNEMIEPKLAFKDGHFTVFEHKGPIANIILGRSAQSERVSVVWVLYQPNITLVQNHADRVSSKSLVTDAVKNFGKPSVRSYLGLGFLENDEDLRMLWSVPSGEGCQIEEIVTPIMGTGGRANIVERHEVEKFAVCPPMLEIRYARMGYNLVSSYLMMSTQTNN